MWKETESGKETRCYKRATQKTSERRERKNKQLRENGRMNVRGKTDRKERCTDERGEKQRDKEKQQQQELQPKREGGQTKTRWRKAGDSAVTPLRLATSQAEKLPIVKCHYHYQATTTCISTCAVTLSTPSSCRWRQCSIVDKRIFWKKRKLFFCCFSFQPKHQ